MVILFLVLTWYEITPMSTSSSCAPFSFFSIGVRDGDMEETTASQKLYLYDYQKQFDHDRIDLVVFGDDDALSKLREHRDELKKVREHIQTICENINVIVTLTLLPLPPPSHYIMTGTSSFWNAVFKISHSLDSTFTIQ